MCSSERTFAQVISVLLNHPWHAQDFIKKKDGSLHLVQDYRVLNAMTVKNHYLLPIISELIAQLRGAKYFTKLDVRWGFNNVQIKEGDEWKAAFHTNRRLYELLVMFFGLTNSPETFQTMMNDVMIHLFSETTHDHPTPHPTTTPNVQNTPTLGSHLQSIRHSRRTFHASNDNPSPKNLRPTLARPRQIASFLTKSTDTISHRYPHLLWPLQPPGDLNG
jgi:Reverse transcriptase (RNA-dependent DNA polymerase)